MMNYVIIGNSAAAVGGIEGIRSRDEQSKITIISEEKYHVYSRPLISYYLSGKVNFEDMKYRSDNFYEKMKVNTRLGFKAVSLTPEKNMIKLNNEEKIKYNKLLLAVGGTPFIPPVTGRDKDNIFTFMKMDDVKNIEDYMKNIDKSGRVLILGAGLIGLKAAEALNKMGLKVTVVELADRILSSILDKEAAAVIQTYLQQQGINFQLSDTIKEFKGSSQAEKAQLRSGLLLDCDLGIMAVGVRPNLELVKNTGIETDTGILVNKKMETNQNNIYAAGDVSEGISMLEGSTGVIPIWPNAYNQGFTAGKNMAGAETEYKEIFARNSISFFDLPIITAGIINPPDSEKKNYEIKIVKAEDKNIYKKVVIKDNQLVGFIFVNTVERAGILTGLIREGKDVSDFKSNILEENFGYLSMDKGWRKDKLYKNKFL